MAIVVLTLKLKIYQSLKISIILNVVGAVGIIKHLKKYMIMFYLKNIEYYAELAYCNNCQNSFDIDFVTGFNSILNNGVFFRCKCNYGAYKAGISKEEYNKYKYLIMPEGGERT